MSAARVADACRSLSGLYTQWPLSMRSIVAVLLPWHSQVLVRQSQCRDIFCDPHLWQGNRMKGLEEPPSGRNTVSSARLSDRACYAAKARLAACNVFESPDAVLTLASTDNRTSVSPVA